MTRALILGASGQLGTALQRSAPRTASFVAHDVGETDICDANAVARALRESRAEVVFNCAAFTRVDDAESERDAAMQANGVAPGLVAEQCAKAGARLIHLSTDYVFDGRGSSPYATDAPVGPINVYGETKLEGERRVLAVSQSNVVVRTAWVHSGGGANFVRTAVNLLSAGKPMRVVDDQIGTPTRALHLAEALWHLSDRSSATGVLHFTDAGVASWFDVAVTVLETLRNAGRAVTGADVTTARTEDFPRPARRPLYSVLDKHASWQAIGYTPPHWRLGVIASTQELVNG
jgi:dTDP-4-dehydrorhamnose reductase